MRFARRQIMDVERREEAHRVDLLEKELILVRKELGHVANEDNIGKEVKKKGFLASSTVVRCVSRTLDSRLQILGSTLAWQQRHCQDRIF